MSASIDNHHESLVRDLTKLTGSWRFYYEHHVRGIKSPAMTTCMKLAEDYDVRMLLVREDETIVLRDESDAREMVAKMLEEERDRHAYGSLKKHYADIGLNPRSVYGYTNHRKSCPRLRTFLTVASDLGYKCAWERAV